MPFHATEYSMRRKIPLYVFFELTRRCNLSCAHCYAVRENRPELSSAAIRDIIDQLEKANALILNFSGGEVFTRKDFFEIAWYARTKNFAIKIFSNGTLIGRSVARKLGSLKPLRVEITVFSTEARIHDSLTGGRGSLKKTLHALELLKKEGIPLRIKTPLLKQNIAGYKDVVRLAHDLGAKIQLDPLIVPRLNGASEPLRLRLSTGQLRRFFEDPLTLSFDRGPRRRTNGYGIVCSAGHNSCTISAYGDVFPCVVLPIPLGNLHTQKFASIWKSTATSVFRRQSRALLARCKGCANAMSCERCPGVSYLEKGGLTEFSSRLCELAAMKSHAYALRQ